MSSSIGNELKITLFGKSHAECVGMTIEGLPSGFKVDLKRIKEDLIKRNPQDEFSTARHEKDDVEWTSGFDIKNNTLTGSPLTFVIRNLNVSSKGYEKGVIRPGTADFGTYNKYEGKEDFEGGGFRSGRMTAPIVVLGSICRQILEQNNIKVATHISEIHGVFDREFDYQNIENDIELLNKSTFAVLDESKAKLMQKEILSAKENLDSVGGMLETIAINVPTGLGEPYFDALDSYVAQLFMSISGVKGVMFGAGLDFAKKYGSELNDQIRAENNKVKFLSNNAGGMLGGYSNGEPIIVKTIVKPTPSISKPQQSVKYDENGSVSNINLEVKGRHDPCIVQRVRIVLDSLLAFAILDLKMVNDKRKEK